ncbi:GlxA family transcriptional regulator [Bordetella genomosp. 4]|uniref:AraC family transcriptional regulator n=1 Tax=Bordetella genomosp. 4 TaxID=463044 RepID=A0A261TM75_9BORD|nr:GlxA family transcriptional regulator [Bordetella genomosp. 4]OZI50699.1 AraC family transcriptional regulator [Bordetella genomosp. 4]
MSTKARSILLLAYPDVQLLDVSGPLQVFASANELLAARGGARPYAPKVVSADPGLVTSSSGLALLSHSLRTVRGPIDTLVVPGGRGVYAATADTRLTDWIRRQVGRSRRIASVCSGAFLLAEAGLLDGRRVATHWSRCDELAKRYPTVRVEADPIFVRDGDIWTSAGVTAGIDLALALLEEDLGRSMALEVARELVVFLKRPGGQSQFSATLSMQNANDQFGELHTWMGEHLGSDLSVPVLARRLHMSERSFMRHYKAETGMTPARAVEKLRVETARRLLVDTAWSVKRIAARCGFGNEEGMRRSFIRLLRISPQAYRERFSIA